MRLIDADALIKILEPHSMRNGAALGWHSGLIDAVIDEIRKMPTIGGWISVKDRMPELEEEVLVYASGKIDGFFGKNVTEISSRYVQKIFPSSPGHECWSSPWQYFHTDYEITHWMPLPEPPEKEKR